MREWGKGGSGKRGSGEEEGAGRVRERESKVNSGVGRVEQCMCV